MVSSPSKLARWVILLLIAVNIYRAATQSITSDEAFTFNRSVITPIPLLWESFDANDHVLHTLLCKATIGLFGVSEFALRIPALFGGVLLLVMFLRLARRLFGESWTMLVVFLLLAFNPFLLDYGSIARGYGMAAALLLVAIEQAMILLDRPMELWRLNGIGVLLALAVAANLTVAVPATALVAVLIAMYVRNRFRLDALIDRLIVTAVVVSVALLIFPLMNAGRVHFYVGARSIVDSATSLAFACFWRPLNLFMHTPLHSPFEAFTSAMGKGLWILIPGVACVAVWFDRKRDRMLLLGVALGAIALIVVLHLLTNGPYPERRTGLYFIPLMTLLAGVAGQRLGKAALVPACFVLVLFAAHWNVQYYDEWIFDSGNRQLMRYIRDHAPLDGRKATIGATFPLDHGVQFYRHKYKLDWLQTPAMHKGADAHYDIYLLTLADLKLIDKYHLIRRKEHPVSHVIVAVPAASPLRP